MEGTLQLLVAVVGKWKISGGRPEIFASQQSWPKINSALRIYVYLYWCNIEHVWDAGNS